MHLAKILESKIRIPSSTAFFKIANYNYFKFSLMEIVKIAHIPVFLETSACFKNVYFKRLQASQT